MDSSDQPTILVPVKAFTEAKARLAGALSPAERAALAQSMATTVLAAANGLPVSVVCDDPEVAGWAEGLGADVLWRPGLGLNGAVSSGVAALAARGVSRVAVVHSDLPDARDLRPVCGGDGVLLVPDYKEDGTNVVAIPAGSGFEFSYGPGSFERHVCEARRLGLPLRVVRSEALGHDLDTPADLDRFTGQL